MKIKINHNDNLPEGDYELTDSNKLENAKGNLSFGSTDRDILLEYDRIAGRVIKNGIVMPPQSLWNTEKKQTEKPINEFSDQELLVIIRRGENTNVSGSLYQRAQIEWQVRHQQKILEATKNGRGGIFFEVGGDMINDGTIHTDPCAHVDVAVAGNYTSNKGKIIQGNLKNRKSWFSMDNPIIWIVATLLVAVLSYIIFSIFGVSRDGVRDLYNVSSQNQTGGITTGKIEINSGGVEVPPEKPDGVLRDFTFIHYPQEITVDQGRTMHENQGWSYLNKIVTLEIAPNDDIYSKY